MDKQASKKTDAQPSEIKLALSMIIEQNEPADVVRKAIESLEEWVDGMFITVTYKETKNETSPLLDLLKEKKANVSFFKWTKRFDEARNFATLQIPKEYNFYIWIDSDDVFVNGEEMRKILREAYIYNWAAVFFDYLYSVEFDEKGKIHEILVTHKRERIIRHDNTLKWMGRLHETLVDQRQANVTKIFRPECKVIHLSDPSRITKNLNRNIEILEAAVQEEGRKDPRTLMYLAKGYFDRARDQEKEVDRQVDFKLAETLFTEYLQGVGVPGEGYVGGSGWREERSTAWEYMGEIYRYNKQYGTAIRATANSLLEAPEFPNYYIDMALTYLLMEKYEKAEIWLEIGKKVPVPDTTIVLMPRDLKARALQVDYQLALAKKDLERAKNSLEKLVKIFPTMEDYADMLKRVEDARIANKVGQSIIFLGRYLESHEGTKEKLANLVQAVPDEFAEEKFVSEMRHKFMPARKHGKDEISIFCGPGFEKWSPKSIDKGIGGSESAVIFLGKELAELGYKVTVYANPQEEAGEYDGVDYKQWYSINQKDEFNIVILWRAIGFTDVDIKAQKVYLWQHDVPNNPDFTFERVKKVDRIFPLSNYQKGLFKMFDKDGAVQDIPDEKFFVTANGIPEYAIDKKVKRNPHSMIYASSYDRGLANLLVIWPKIREEVPDAELHIYYGWNLFDSFFKDNPERMAWKAKMVEMMKQPGITEHGRIPQGDLVKEFQRSGIFAYPTDFQEISCQNAMFAQKYGAIPVVTDYAALKETVLFGKKVNTDITSRRGKEEYIVQLVEALKDTKWQALEREKMMEACKDKFKWSTIAKTWKELFNV